MKKELFKIRKYELVEVINRIKRLPNIWEYTFSDGEDMRIWYDSISQLGIYNDYIREINILINKYRIRTLSDKELEEQFINTISKLKHLPKKNEVSFTDNTDMYSWYIKYKNNNPSFEYKVKEYLPEYIDIDLTNIWPSCKQEFINILKQLKRVPRYGEYILDNNIDIRVLYDKLQHYDPVFFEKLLLHLETYKLKKLSIDKRIEELRLEVIRLGYIPYLQESRFSDGTDMFTWYMRYKDKMPELSEELSKYTINKDKNITIYTIPKFINRTGKYYNHQTNIDEQLDLSNLISYENLDKQDSIMKGRTR